MNLLCPSCQKMVTVENQYAGQQMRCPHCNSIFTVPALPPEPSPPTMAPGGPPTAPAPYKMPDVPAPPPPPSVPTPAPPPEPPAPVITRDYEKMKSIFISPRILPWVSFGSIVLVFLLTFFPFGATTGSDKKIEFKIGKNMTVDEMNKLADKDIESLRKDAKENIDGLTNLIFIKGNAWGLGFGLGGNVLYVFFDLFVVFALLAAVGCLLMQLKVIPVPPVLAPWRAVIVGIFLGGAFFFQALNQFLLLFSFGMLPLSFWGLLALAIHVLGLIVVLLEIWLQRRGPSAPMPRIDIHT